VLGLGSNITKAGKIGKPIVKDGLVLKHGYAGGPVQPVSTGAADINADADVNEYIDVGTIAIADGDVSISAWVYVTAFVDEAAIFSNRHNSVPNQGIELRCGASSDFEIFIDEATSSSTAAVTSAKNTNQWYHVCGVWDRSGTQYMYVDGVLDGTPDDITSQADSLAHTTTARIGRDAGSTDFRGYICNVGYWNAVLTQAQVKSIMHKDYASLSASEKTNLVSWWNLDSTVVTGHADHPFISDNHYAGGSELGSEMWDGENGSTTHWAIFGNNDITTDDGAVKITFDDDPSGWYINLADDDHLNANLVVGKRYKITLTTKVDSGSVLWKIQETGDPTYSMPTPVTSTEFVQQSMYFTASHVSGHYLFPSQHLGLSNGDSVWIKDISVKLVNGNTGTLS
jgi:hypothetical protein